MKASLRIVGFAVGFLAPALTGAFAQQPALGIQLVSTFDYPGTGNLTRPQKISDKGDIIGIYVDSAAVSRGFIMFANGSFSPPLVDPNDTGGNTEGRGINTSRLACGDYLDAGLGTFHGFFFSHNTFQNYDVPNSTTTIVLGLNNVGDFCGSATPTGGIQSGFLSVGSAIAVFAVQDATATLAYQLNATNQSCGYYINADGSTHGFFRDNNGRLHPRIDPAGATSTILFGNNDANLMVGRYVDAAGVTHGILFEPPDRFVVYDFPGSTFTSLNGINRKNEIVGRYTDNSTGIDHGIIAQVVRTADSITLPLAAPSAPVGAVRQRVVDTRPAY
jgi:hypothetical protein